MMSTFYAKMHKIGMSCQEIKEMWSRSKVFSSCCDTGVNPKFTCWENTRKERSSIKQSFLDICIVRWNH